MIFPPVTLAVNVDLDVHTTKLFDADPITQGHWSLTPLSNTGKAHTLSRNPRLGDPLSQFRSSVEFYRASEEEERCLDVLKCTPLVRQLAQKKCEVEILQAMVKGGELEDCTFVRCTPWVDKPLKVETKTIEWTTLAMPTALRGRCTQICSQLGATVPLPTPPIGISPKSLRQKARYDWAERIYVEVEGGSAHEIMVRLGSLIDEIKALEAAIAATP